MISKEQLNTMQPEEYLEKTGVSSILKDIMGAVLENRPQNPIRFISEYLKTSSPSCSGLIRSYKLIKLCPSTQQAFMDNLCGAYMNIDNRRGGNDSGLTGSEYMKLINMLCLDFPGEIVEEVLAVFGKGENESLGFEDFVAGIHSVILYEEFFEEAETLFKHLDPQQTGIVNKRKLFEALEKLSLYNVDVNFPPKDVLQQAFDRFIDSEDMSFTDFALALFKTTI